MLTLELSAEIIQETSGASVLGMPHFKILIDENRDIRIVDIDSYLALVIYDYILTFSSEVTFFWKPRRLNGAMILFVFNRYLILTAQILTWIPFPPSFQVRCLVSR